MQELNQIHSLLQTINACKKKLTAKTNLCFPPIRSTTNGKKSSLLITNYNLADYRSKCVLTGILKFRLELDLAYKEPITFLKMDIEGSEINALLGAKEHVVNDKPRLAVCTYHNYSHLWQAMQTIRQLRPDYRFYLRFYGKEGSVTESEHVLYAI